MHSVKHLKGRAAPPPNGLGSDGLNELPSSPTNECREPPVDRGKDANWGNISAGPLFSGHSLKILQDYAP